MAIALGNNSGIRTASSVVTASYALGTVAIDDLIIVSIAHWHGGAPVGMNTVGDGLGNTYTKIDNQAYYNNGSVNEQEMSIWYSKVTTGGSCTVTITPNATSANYITWHVASWTGSAASPLDQHTKNVGTNTATDSNVTAPGANAQNDMLVMAACSPAIGSSGNVHLGAAASTGYTNIAIYQAYNVINSISADYKIISAGETSSASWSHDDCNVAAKDSWGAVIATFKAAVAATAPVGTGLVEGRMNQRMRLAA